jgi:hypothetical protein
MRTRLYIAGIFGALALLAVALVVVIQFGRHDPSPPSLKDNPRPEIPGRVLYYDHQQCFTVAQASGAGEEHLGCAGRVGGIGPEFWWDGADTVRWVQRVGPEDGKVIEVNIRTGEQRETGETVPAIGGFGKIQPIPQVRELQECIQGPDGAFGCTDRDGSLVIVEGDTPTKVAEFDLPEYNRPHMKAWSPDGRWLMLEYYPQRAPGPELWIVSRDGSVRGTLVSDNTTFSRVAWAIDGVGVWPVEPN